MLRCRIALSFNLNLNPFYSVKVNLLDFKDANDSIISQLTVFCHDVLVSKVIVADIALMLINYSRIAAFM